MTLTRWKPNNEWDVFRSWSKKHCIIQFLKYLWILNVTFQRLIYIDLIRLYFRNRILLKSHTSLCEKIMQFMSEQKKAFSISSFISFPVNHLTLHHAAIFLLVLARLHGEKLMFHVSAPFSIRFSLLCWHFTWFVYHEIYHSELGPKSSCCEHCSFCGVSPFNISRGPDWCFFAVAKGEKESKQNEKPTTVMKARMKTIKMNAILNRRKDEK